LRVALRWSWIGVVCQHEELRGQHAKKQKSIREMKLVHQNQFKTKVLWTDETKLCRGKCGGKQEGSAHDLKPPTHLSNTVLVLVWLECVRLPVELARWHLLMISLLTEATG